MKKYTIPFTRILYQNEQFCIEVKNTYYRLHCSVGEYYILLNLCAEFKKEALLLFEINEQKGKSVLCPVAIIKNEQLLWLTVTEDKKTDYSPIPDLSLITSCKTEAGEEYSDGFIDAARTFLSYGELMSFESLLHKTDYVNDFCYAWQQKYPGTPYDVRLHYFMIKNIRKHRHYTDDFNLPCHAQSFYHG